MAGLLLFRANRRQHTRSHGSRTPTSTSYRVRAITKDLRIRKGPGTNYGIAQNAIAPGIYTIVAESSGTGSANGWGKLKSGASWISLDYAMKV